MIDADLTQLPSKRRWRSICPLYGRWHDAYDGRRTYRRWREISLMTPKLVGQYVDAADSPVWMAGAALTEQRTDIDSPLKPVTPPCVVRASRLSRSWSRDHCPQSAADVVLVR